SSSLYLSAKVSIPSPLIKGSAVPLWKTINSNLKITRVRVGFKNKNGKWLSGYPITRYPRTKSYSLGKINSAIKFGKLQVGTYYFVIEARNSRQIKTLQSTKFSVVAPKPASTPPPQSNVIQQQNEPQETSGSLYSSNAPLNVSQMKVNAQHILDFCAPEAGLSRRCVGFWEIWKQKAI
ncbi:hypothetical protein, partial [Treponema sp. R6D11]